MRLSTHLTRVGTVLIVIILAMALVAAAGRADAAPGPKRSFIAYTCGVNLCKVDPATRKVVRLTRDGTSAAKYGTVSVSRNGARTAFTYRGQLFVAGRNLTTRRRLTKDAQLAVAVRPDGRQVAAIQSGLTVIPCALPGCPPTVAPSPILWIRDAVGAAAVKVRTNVVAAGWLDGRIMRSDRTQRPRKICVIVSPQNSDCERTVAVDPTRDVWDPVGVPGGQFVVGTLVQPAPGRDGDDIAGKIAVFDAATGALVRELTSGPADEAPTVSPDGTRVAFNRGSGLFVIRLDGSDGGKARRIARNAVRPSWGGGS